MKITIEANSLEELQSLLQQLLRKQRIEFPDETPIESLRLRSIAVKALHAGNIKTVGELVRRTSMDLLKLPDFGNGLLAEVEDHLEKRGLQLAG